MDTLSLSLSTSYLFNYPTASFARLPISLTISLSQFKSSVRHPDLTPYRSIKWHIFHADKRSTAFQVLSFTSTDIDHLAKFCSWPNDNFPDGEPRQAGECPKTSRVDPTPSEACFSNTRDTENSVTWPNKRIIGHDYRNEIIVPLCNDLLSLDFYSITIPYSAHSSHKSWHMNP